jgi:hypothetical protein
MQPSNANWIFLLGRLFQDSQLQWLRRRKEIVKNVKSGQIDRQREIEGGK